MTPGRPTGLQRQSAQGDSRSRHKDLLLCSREPNCNLSEADFSEANLKYDQLTRLVVLNQATGGESG